MKVTTWLLVTLAAVGAFAGLLQAQTENTPTLSISSIVAPPIVKVGSEITVAIILQNKSGRTIHMYWPNNDEAGDDEYTITVLDEEGRRPPLTWAGRNVIDHKPGIRLGRPHFANRDVADGDVLTEKLTISKFFDFSKPGKYAIQLSRGDRKTNVKSNTVTVTVIP